MGGNLLFEGVMYMKLVLISLSLVMYIIVMFRLFVYDIKKWYVCWRAKTFLVFMCVIVFIVYSVITIIFTKFIWLLK